MTLSRQNTNLCYFRAFVKKRDIMILQRNAEKNNFKEMFFMKCKFCQSEIDDKCIVCPVCHRDLDVKPSDYKKVMSDVCTYPCVWNFFGIAVGVLIVFMVLTKACGVCCGKILS